MQINFRPPATTGNEVTRLIFFRFGFFLLLRLILYFYRVCGMNGKSSSSSTTKIAKVNFFSLGSSGIFVVCEARRQRSSSNNSRSLASFTLRSCQMRVPFDFILEAS